MYYLLVMLVLTIIGVSLSFLPLSFGWQMTFYTVIIFTACIITFAWQIKALREARRKLDEIRKQDNTKQ